MLRRGIDTIELDEHRLLGSSIWICLFFFSFMSFQIWFRADAQLGARVWMGYDGARDCLPSNRGIESGLFVDRVSKTIDSIQDVPDLPDKISSSHMPN